MSTERVSVRERVNGALDRAASKILIRPITSFEAEKEKGQRIEKGLTARVLGLTAIALVAAGCQNPFSRRGEAPEPSPTEQVEEEEAVGKEVQATATETVTATATRTATPTIPVVEGVSRPDLVPPQVIGEWWPPRKDIIEDGVVPGGIQDLDSVDITEEEGRLFAGQFNGSMAEATDPLMRQILTNVRQQLEKNFGIPQDFLLDGGTLAKKTGGRETITIRALNNITLRRTGTGFIEYSNGVRLYKVKATNVEVDMVAADWTGDETGEAGKLYPTENFLLGDQDEVLFVAEGFFNVGSRRFFFQVPVRGACSNFAAEVIEIFEVTATPTVRPLPTATPAPAVPPTETPVPAPPAPTVAPTVTPQPPVEIQPTVTPQPPVPTFTPQPTITPTVTPQPPEPTFTPQPTVEPTVTPQPTPEPTFTPQTLYLGDGQILIISALGTATLFARTKGGENG